MTPERLQRIEDLYHAARERAAAERDAFVAEACGDDLPLRTEVQSLLAQRDGTLLRQGIGAVAGLVVPPTSGSHEGRTLGAYLLGPLLGVGGMGEVYRARDTRLGRDVALKILPEDFARHPERLARFEREARVLATLNHPNIGAIYGLEESDGVRALVLELVDGVTLADRLGDAAAARPLPVDAALPLARQIAEALEAAHDKGIVHRDLKPANIKITPHGVVKVLDFGIAKIRGAEPDGLALLDVRETAEGVVLGTVAYMSPEQARGLPVDKRTDIWAFGCVVYEMLTGARSFPGQSSADVLGAITTAGPDWSLLPPDTPIRVRNMLQRCLTKDRARRLHDIADARLEIEDAIADPRAIAEGERGRPPVEHRLFRLAPWILVGVLAAVSAVALRYAVLAPPPETRGLARVSIPLPPDVSVFEIGRGSSVAVSPDSRRIVYVGIAGGRRQLYLRDIDGLDSTPIAGTEDAASPVFSPDGRWIAFTTLPDGGSLMRVPADGGRVLSVVDNMGDGQRGFAVQGVAWGVDETIVFGALNPRSIGLWRVSSSGGTPERISAAGEGGTWPQILPGGTHVIYTRPKRGGFDVAVQSMTGGSHTILVEGASYGRVISPDGRRGWLVYARPEGLHAARFDLERLEVAGTAVPLLDGVQNNLSGGAHFAVSPDGLLAYIPGGLDEVNKTLLWVRRDGTADTIGMIPGVDFQFSLSPNGRWLVRPEATLGGSRDLFVDDLVERTTPRRVTDATGASFPIWTPDGRRVIYASGEPNPNLFWRAADRSDDPERLTTSSNSQTPGSVSPDGSTLAFHEAPDGRPTDIWLLPLRQPREPRLLMGAPFAELDPKFSPDGRWLAYRSTISGRFEVWVARVDGGGQFPVSRGGGDQPLWSSDGRELYYRDVPRNQPGNIMAVTFDGRGTQPTIGVPRVLFATTHQGNIQIGPDGRFLMVEGTRRASPSRVIHLVFGWFDDLQGKLPLN